VGSLAGLILSVAADLPAGAVIVWCLAIAALLFAYFMRPLIADRE
jgi:ABC-type Mn2+/Zn2+ transport system permease subunit